MAFKVGDRVTDPRMPRLHRVGRILEVHCNPACLMPILTVAWDDGEEEELEAIEFGPLTDG